MLCDDLDSLTPTRVFNRRHFSAAVGSGFAAAVIPVGAQTSRTDSQGLIAGELWYSRWVGERSPLKPSHPIDVVHRLNAPVLALHGGQDAGLSLESIDQMKAALSGGNVAAKRSEFVVYPDAPLGSKPRVSGELSYRRLAGQRQQ